jgi:hypothetical protein
MRTASKAGQAKGVNQRADPAPVVRPSHCIHSNWKGHFLAPICTHSNGAAFVFARTHQMVQ